MTSEFAIAVHALVYLNHKNTILASDALAENVCTNPARIRKVMARLKKAGIVVTKEGIDGGYCMKRDPADIDLRQVCEALEVSAVSSNWRSGNKDMSCLIASGMADVMDDIYKEMDEVCKKRLEKITIKDIDGRIFGN